MFKFDKGNEFRFFYFFLFLAPPLRTPGYAAVIIIITFRWSICARCKPAVYRFRESLPLKICLENNARVRTKQQGSRCAKSVFGYHFGTVAISTNKNCSITANVRGISKILNVINRKKKKDRDTYFSPWTSHVVDGKPGW